MRENILMSGSQTIGIKKNYLKPFKFMQIND